MIVPPEVNASKALSELSHRICRSGIRFALSIVLGYLRHERESLNKGQGGKMRKSTSSLAHYSMPPTSGYSSTGCSPAEPISASPDTLCPRYSSLIRISTLFNQRIRERFDNRFNKFSTDFSLSWAPYQTLDEIALKLWRLSGYAL